MKAAKAHSTHNLKKFFENKKPPGQPMPKGDIKANTGVKMRDQLGATRKKTEPDNPVKEKKKFGSAGLAKKRLEGVKI